MKREKKETKKINKNDKKKEFNVNWKVDLKQYSFGFISF